MNPPINATIIKSFSQMTPAQQELGNLIQVLCIEYSIKNGVTPNEVMEVLARLYVLGIKSNEELQTQAERN